MCGVSTGRKFKMEIGQISFRVQIPFLEYPDASLSILCHHHWTLSIKFFKMSIDGHFGFLLNSSLEKFLAMLVCIILFLTGADLWVRPCRPSQGFRGRGPAPFEFSRCLICSPRPTLRIPKRRIWTLCRGELSSSTLHSVTPHVPK